MALNQRQKYVVLGAFIFVFVVIAAWQLLVIVASVETTPKVSLSRNAEQMLAGYSLVKSNATQDDVIGVMGSQFAVRKCAENADPNCAHIWHYESGGEAWDFTFDMDGNLMGKKLGTAGE